MAQKVLILTTNLELMRDAVWAWDCEDANLFVSDKHIGFTPPPRFSYSHYATVLEALADGWHLLGQPQHVERSESSSGYFEWWLVKD